MGTLAKTLRIALLLGASACNLASQATSRTVVVSTVLATPSVVIGPQAFAARIDAGVTVPSDGGVTVPGIDLVATFFGELRGTNTDVAPAGIAGAAASLEQSGGHSWPLDDQGGGNYTMKPDIGFQYAGHATYDFVVSSKGVTYRAEVSDVPEVEVISELHPQAGFIELVAGSPLTLSRPNSSGGTRPIAFVSVFPISADGARGQATYTNLPKDALAYLKLAVAPAEWQTASVTIPGRAFPEADRNYLIVFQSAKLGGPKSDNVFLGSPVLAGIGDVGVVRTATP
jgi:hypothetical protein